MAESEIRQDAAVAAGLGPPALRTPRWIWAWMLPALILIMLFMARRVLGPFVIAAIIAYIFSMVIDQIQDRLRWPRALIVSLLYLVVLGALGVGLYFGAEALYQQTREFIVGGPNILEKGITQLIGTSHYTFGGQEVNAHTLAIRINEGLSEYFGNGDAIHLAGELVTRLLDVILVVMVSFYLLIDGKRLGAYLMKYIPAGSRARTGYVAGRIHTVLGAYLRGQLLLIGIMSLVSFLVLQFVFQVPYALPLGIMTGFLEILPLVGPAVAAAIAAGVALSAHGAGTAIAVVVAYTILRQLEDQLVMPFVVGRAVELHPVATIFAVLAGGAMAGALGMLIAVPVAAAIKVVLDFLYPTDPEAALAEAGPGIRKAQREAEARDEEPAPKTPASEVQSRPADR
ncbi:MAG TPA: AI-2E family transporter [Chloroflexia bacterium]|nr:AI-2E family transporter [Chloroflexia bacterium]